MLTRKMGRKMAAINWEPVMVLPPAALALEVIAGDVVAVRILVPTPAATLDPPDDDDAVRKDVLIVGVGEPSGTSVADCSYENWPFNPVSPASLLSMALPAPACSDCWDPEGPGK